MGFNQVHSGDHCVTGFGRDKPQKLYLTGHVARRKCEEDETCLWDTELPGFGLRRYITGRKSWFLRYIERGVARIWTIGDVKRVSAEDARERARKRLKEVALRGLPTRPKRSKIAAKVATFSELVEQYFEDRPFAWKPSTEKTNVHSIHRVLVPAFGTMQVSSIRKHDVLRWRDEMSDRPGAFNRDVALISGVMQYAERLGLRKLGSNPARGVPRYAREPLQRFLNATELKRLHCGLAECDDTYMVAAIRLLIHTGARSSEIANLNLTPHHVMMSRYRNSGAIIIVTIGCCSAPIAGHRFNRVTQTNRVQHMLPDTFLGLLEMRVVDYFVFFTRRACVTL